MKNDSYIHDIVGNLQKPTKTAEVSGVRQQSCDISEGQGRSHSRHSVYKNKRNNSSFNVISGEVQVPITFSKRVFPEREEGRMNPIL